MSQAKIYGYRGGEDQQSIIPEVSCIFTYCPYVQLRPVRYTAAVQLRTAVSTTWKVGERGHVHMNWEADPNTPSKLHITHVVEFFFDVVVGEVLFSLRVHRGSLTV